MPDYSTGKIYKIFSPSHPEAGYYVGSTIGRLSKRFYGHKTDYNRHKSGVFPTGYTSSIVLFEYDDVMIELIELCPCSCKDELNKREGEIIRMGGASVVNKMVAGRTKKEYAEDTREHRLEHLRNYRETHKAEIRAVKQKYYQENKEEVKAKVRAYRELKAEARRESPAE